MRVDIDDYDNEEEEAEEADEPKKKKKTSLNVASTIIKDVGGITVATKCSNTFLDLAERLFPKNTKYQGTVKLAQKGNTSSYCRLSNF